MELHNRLGTPLLVVLGVALLAWLWITVPMATGADTFFYRDIGGNHLPIKQFGARYLRQGQIPTFNPDWGLGQPFRGNPGALPFYPGNLLYLVLPFWSAFNLHLCLHWLIAGISMWFLARRLGQGPAGAAMAAVTYFGSGWMVSNLTFYNLITVGAWWPLVMALALGKARRDLALAGLVCGVCLLGGGPILAALGLVPLLMVATRVHGWRSAWLRVGAIGVLGLLIAAPQMVATWRVLAFSVRGASDPLLEEVVAFSFHPMRSLELLVPFPFGWPVHGPPFGLSFQSFLPRVPYFLTMYQGIVALGLAALAAWRHRGWAALALAGLVGASVVDNAGEMLISVAGGFFRYPEKLLFWFALALPILAGFGLERALAPRPEGTKSWWVRAIVTGSVFVTALGVGLWAIRPWAGTELARLFPSDLLKAQTLYARLEIWMAGLLVAGTCLMVLALLLRRHHRGADLETPSGRSPSWAAAAIVLLQILTLLQLKPIFLRTETAPLRAEPRWASYVEPGDQILGGYAIPNWTAVLSYLPDLDPKKPLRFLPSPTGAPALGTFQGLGYPLAANAEGLGSVLKQRLQMRLATADWPQRVNWLRVLGIRLAIFGEEAPPLEHLQLLEVDESSGVSYHHYAVGPSAELVRWPTELIAAPSLTDAIRAISDADDPVAILVVPSAVGQLDHDPQGSVTLLEESADRIVFDVESQGGVVALRRAFHPLLEATIDQQPLTAFYTNVFLTGIEVPPGRHRVVVAAAGAGPEIAAGLLALIVAFGCLWIGRPTTWARQSLNDRALNDQAVTES